MWVRVEVDTDMERVERRSRSLPYSEKEGEAGAKMEEERLGTVVDEASWRAVCSTAGSYVCNGR